MKNKEELNTLKAEVEEMKGKLAELSTEELQTVFGGSEDSYDPAWGEEVVARAVGELGKPYSWGGVGPDGYDASGFVSYCLTGVNARLGTTDTFMGWPEVSDPQPGDVCTNSYCCGIYVSPGTMIYVSGSAQIVTYGGILGDMKIVRR